MPHTPSQAHVRRIGDRLHRGLGDDVRRLREDGGLRRASLAAAAGIDPTYLQRIEDGMVRATIETYVRLATALGADLTARLYPNTGPVIRDRHQARILEWLLSRLHPRWRPFTEVAVRQPARGWIDLVLHDAAASCVVATEIQSALPRIEQLVRWSGEKSSSLPSWEGFAHLGAVSVTSKLLVVRSTRTTRSIAKDFGRQLELAYPAHPQDAIQALVGTREWPGPALVWVDVGASGMKFLERR